MGITDYSTNPSDNTSISGLTVSDSTLFDAVDNIIRQLMADIKSAIGTDLQAYDANLAALAALTLAANKGVYATGASTFDTFDLTSVARTLLAASDVAAQRAALGLGTAAVVATLDEDDMASDSPVNVPTQQSVKAFVEGTPSLVTNGYQVFPSGLVWQWGETTVGGDSATDILWPLTFPTACLQAQVSIGAEVSLTSDAAASIYNLTTTGARIQNGTVSAVPLRWFAVGH